MASHTAAAVFPGGLSAAPYAYPGFHSTFSKLYAHRMNVDGPISDGKIVGTTKAKGLPANIPTKALVRVYRDSDGAFSGQVLSDEVTGAYEFLGLYRDWKYTVVAYDLKSLYRAVVADALTPDPL